MVTWGLVLGLLFGWLLGAWTMWLFIRGATMRPDTVPPGQGSTLTVHGTGYEFNLPHPGNWVLKLYGDLSLDSAALFDGDVVRRLKDEGVEVGLDKPMGDEVIEAVHEALDHHLEQYGRPATTLYLSPRARDAVQGIASVPARRITRLFGLEVQVRDGPDVEVQAPA